MPTRCFSKIVAAGDDDPTSRGLRRAEAELAKLPEPKDPTFYNKATGEPHCRWGVGTLECLNGAECLNPHHNRPHCEACGWAWDGIGAAPVDCPACKKDCPRCNADPPKVCRHPLELRPADPKDPWSVDVRIKTDRWNRYILPHPITGKEQAWTRVTTAADTLEDKYGIISYEARNVAYGMGQRPDLVTLAASADGPDDKRLLGDVVEQAKQAAASARKANLGTALHAFTQRIDRGDRDVRVPADHRDRIIRYKTAVAQHRLGFPHEYIETIVCLVELSLCGTTDRLAEWVHSPELVAYDLKTGSLDYIKVKTSQQLAAYANASHWWDPETEIWHEMPPVNKKVALVMHLPAETDDEPRLFSVNIEEGWRLLNTSMEVRTLRSGKGKHLFTEITADAMPTPAANREEDLRERVRLIAAVPAAKQALLGMWPSDVPTLAEGGLTDAQLDQVEGWCQQVEREHRL